ncbi:unnamed protein product, partial [Medioppia subpectinata]
PVFETDYWGTDITSEHSHKSYRPLTVITFRLNYLLNGLHPEGYHVVNALLHLIVVQLFYRFCLQFLNHRRMALIASILFAVHPLKTEAVSGVVGRAELLSTTFFLISLMSYMKRRYFVFICGVICAILSKEQGLTVLAVCLAYEVSNCLCRTSTVKRSFLMTIVRIAIMGGKHNLPVFTKFDNPASFESYPSRHLTYNYLLPLNAWL